MNEKFDRNDESLRQIQDDNKLMNEKLEENNKHCLLYTSIQFHPMIGKNGC